MYIVTSKQMYRAEAAAVASGTTFTELMERAGRTCAGIIRDEYCKDGKKNILIISCHVESDLYHQQGEYFITPWQLY